MFGVDPHYSNERVTIPCDYGDVQGFRSYMIVDIDIPPLDGDDWSEQLLADLISSAGYVHLVFLDQKIRVNKTHNTHPWVPWYDNKISSEEIEANARAKLEAAIKLHRT